MATTSTKDKILQAAIHLLETAGVKGLTQPAVAKMVGIPQGQLTYHFRHRSDLVLAVCQSAMDGVAEYLWTHHPTLASKSFAKLLGLVLEEVKSKTRMRALLGLIVESDESPEVREQLLEQGMRVRALIATALQVPEDSPEVTTAHSVMVGFGIMFFLQPDKKERIDLEKHFQAAVKILEKHLQDGRRRKS